MLTPTETYEQAYNEFRWQVPQSYNIAVDVVDRHAISTPGAIALIYEDTDGSVREYSFLDIQRLINRFANVLAARGFGRGDRIAVLLGQRPETAVAHVAAYKMGAIAIPMFTLFGEEALEFRLLNSEARAVITDQENFPKIAALRDRLPGLKDVFIVDGNDAAGRDLAADMEKASDVFAAVKTNAEEPALLSYTSGTTGPPKGELHAHRVMLGHMPGFDILHSFFGQEGDLSRSPADWAWIAGLMDVLLPTWWHGKPVLAFRARKFDPEQAYHMMAKHRVRNALLLPTMLKLMRQVANPPSLDLRSLITGGEAVGEELHDWGRGHFGFALNEGYGQTECNLVLCHVPDLMPAKFGALGKAVPGHVGEIVDSDGNPVGPGEEGQIAFRRPDPVMLLEYWKNPQGTNEKFAGDWLLTGDLGRKDKDGYFWFVSLADDVITSSGYRIGPGEIEDCLSEHPAVALSAAIGVPDPVRTEIIKVFIVAADGHPVGPELESDIREFVRSRLAAHEYPREVAFVDSLPTTATGKVMRRELRQAEVKKIEEAKVS